ncbi:MAG: MucBP domain-containing protein, partial [Clostridia bacterium]|nr:MucBP domain-containing protein [Clostridia bacterium]
MKGFFRVFALVTALICLALPIHGLAAAQDISISVQWADPSGALMTSTVALPMSGDPNETRYWLTVPPDAQMDALILQINDLSGQYTMFSPGSGEYLTGVFDASLNPQAYISILMFDAQGNSGPVLTLYISTQEMPAEQTPVSPALVTVRYADDQGNLLLPDEIIEVPEGQQTIAAREIDGYTLWGQDAYTVTVDASGASMNEITFYYTRVPVIARVTVRY